LARNPFARKYEDDEDYSGISSSSSDTDDDTSNNNNSPVQKELQQLYQQLFKPKVTNTRSLGNSPTTLGQMKRKAEDTESSEDELPLPKKPDTKPNLARFVALLKKASKDEFTRSWFQEKKDDFGVDKYVVHNVPQICILQAQAKRIKGVAEMSEDIGIQPFIRKLSGSYPQNLCVKYRADDKKRKEAYLVIKKTYWDSLNC
jgi:hypothetical protein